MSPADETFPTEPKAFGDEMRRLREGAGVSLQEIASETKVSARILEALESGKFQYLPAPVFVRNFVRQYARVIGFDPDRLVAWFDAAWESFNLASGIQPALQVVEPAPRPSFQWRFWLPVALAGLILAVVVVVVWRARTGSERLRSVTPAVAGTAAISPRAFPSPSVAAPFPSPSPALAPTASETLTVAVRVSEGKECWIRYRDGEGRTDQRLLTGGSEASFKLPGPVLLTLGSAGVATVEVNGEAYQDLGRPGQVVHLQLTSAGVHLLGSADASG